MAKYALYRNGSRVSEIKRDDNVPDAGSVVKLDGRDFKVEGVAEVRVPGDYGTAVVDHFRVDIEPVEQPEAPNISPEAQKVRDDLKLGHRPQRPASQEESADAAAARKALKM